MDGQIAGVTDELSSYIDQLKNKGIQFSQAYAIHMSNYEKAKNNPQLLAQWTSIKNYADKVKLVIQTINNSVDSGVNWLKDVFGFKTDNLSGVGALPLIPIAYVVGALAALGYVINQMVQFNTLVNKGASVDQLLNQGKGGVLSDMSSLIKYGVIAAALYFAWKKWGK